MDGRLAEGQKMKCLLQGWKAKNRRWQACYRDGRLSEGKKMKGLLQGLKTG
jgi:hypothetical protein